MNIEITRIEYVKRVKHVYYKTIGVDSSTDTKLDSYYNIFYKFKIGESVSIVYVGSYINAINQEIDVYDINKIN